MWLACYEAGHDLQPGIGSARRQALTHHRHGAEPRRRRRSTGQGAAADHDSWQFEAGVGRLVWNRLCHLKDPDTGKRVSRLNPESEWVTQDVPELRIVDQEVWDAAKAHQKTLAHKSPAGPSESWIRRSGFEQGYRCVSVRHSPLAVEGADGEAGSA